MSSPMNSAITDRGKSGRGGGGEGGEGGGESKVQKI